MNILFLTNDYNSSVGSTRIWINNLGKWLKEKDNLVFYNQIINNHPPKVCLIQKKYPIDKLNNFKKKYPNLVYIMINPSVEDLINSQIKFCLVGSKEEFELLSDYAQCILFPLVEDFYESKRKIHYKKDNIIIGYHGNKVHLENMSEKLIRALNILNKEMNIELSLIYDFEKLNKFKNSKIKLKINHIQWNYNTIENEIKKFDIGIVPTLLNNSFFQNLFLNKKKNINLTFKGKTNSGRILLFHQLGIPAVAEISISNAKLILSDDFGYLAYSENSWYLHLKKLAIDHNLRESISKKSFQNFHKYFNRDNLLNKFINDLNYLVKL